jgi:hypothetical protein
MGMEGRGRGDGVVLRSKVDDGMELAKNSAFNGTLGVIPDTCTEGLERRQLLPSVSSRHTTPATAMRTVFFDGSSTEYVLGSIRKTGPWTSRSNFIGTRTGQYFFLCELRSIDRWIVGIVTEWCMMLFHGTANAKIFSAVVTSTRRCVHTRGVPWGLAQGATKQAIDFHFGAPSMNGMAPGFTNCAKHSVSFTSALSFPHFLRNRYQGDLIKRSNIIDREISPYLIEVFQMK